MRALKEEVPVIFVGSFRSATGDGGVGGQMYACRSLVSSGISRHVRWICIDSTMTAIPPPSMWGRARLAARRTFRLSWLLMTERRARVLVFAGDGPSFLEKGVMILLARMLGRHAVICPRSGIILDDLARSAFFRAFVPFVLRRASVTICQSSQWLDLFASVVGVPRDRLRLIPNWVSCADYLPVASARQRNRPIRTFLYLGWIEEFKGIFDLIDAVAGRRGNLSGARFVICGSGSRFDAATQRVRSLGLESQFEFRGWVHGAEKTAALLEADVLVLPSRREGMPNVILEAMASGLPVLATTVGGVPDVIQTGVTGLLVSPESPDELGRALEKCVVEQDAVRAWGLAALKVVLDNHDIEAAWPRVLRALGVEGEGSGASAN